MFLAFAYTKFSGRLRVAKWNCFMLTFLQVKCNKRVQERYKKHSQNTQKTLNILGTKNPKLFDTNF